MTTSERKWIGKSLPRVEDRRLLAGNSYIDDVRVAGMLHAAVLGSSHAHARIKSIDVREALKVPGVAAVITGKELVNLVGPMPAFSKEPIEQWALAVDKVRFAGEGVVAVAATSRYIAEEACRRVVVEYEPLPVLTDPRQAIEPGATIIHESHGSNLVFERIFDFGEVDSDFARADRVVRRTLRWHRMLPQPTETCGAILRWEGTTQRMTAWANVSMFNMFGSSFASMLNVDLGRLTIIPSPAVGGSFGNSKNLMGKVLCIAGALSKATGRPVKFLEDRREHMMATDGAGPDRRYEAELAMTDAGRFLSLKIDVLDDYGAYYHFGLLTHNNALAQPVGPYRIGSLRYGVKAVLTNKGQQGIFRGAGSDVGNFVIERLVDAAAAELGMDRAEIRRLNFIQPDEFPYTIPTGNVYDSGDYERVLSIAMEDERTRYWLRERDRLRSEGRYLGVGIATCQERTNWNVSEFWVHDDEPAFPATRTPEGIRVAVDVSGGLLVTLGGPIWGNSPETVVSQVLAEELGVDPSTISFQYADSQAGILSPGPGGSRLTIMLSGAAAGAATEIKSKAMRIASSILEIDEDDLDFSDGRVEVKGNPAVGLALGEIAFQNTFFQSAAPAGSETGLQSLYTYDHPFNSLPTEDRSSLGAFYPFVSHACHLAVVEVDPETGVVTVVAFLAVSDCGTVMNPMLLAGQIRGGIVQGIGAALLEEVVFDEDGQMLTPTLAEYLIPNANLVPEEFRVLHHETPSPFSKNGVKGGGEGGRMVAPAAVASAVEDALRSFGVRVTELPLTPERIVESIREGAK